MAQVVTKNGLIWDKHSLHYSDKVVKYISDSNKDPYNPTIISTLLDEGLALTIQVLDVAVNKVFKQKLKEYYYRHQLEQHVEL